MTAPWRSKSPWSWSRSHQISLLTADVQASSGSPWNEETKAVLERHYNSPLVEAHTETIETATMLRSIKAVW